MATVLQHRLLRRVVVLQGRRVLVGRRHVAAVRGCRELRLLLVPIATAAAAVVVLVVVVVVVCVVNVRGRAVEVALPAAAATWQAVHLVLLETLVARLKRRLKRRQRQMVLVRLPWRTMLLRRMLCATRSHTRAVHLVL